LAARPKKLPTVLNTPEVQELLKQPNRKCPTGLRNYLVMLLMYRAGLRVSDVPLETYVLDSLRKWKAERPKGNKFFTTLKGEELNDRYIRTFVKRYAGKANIQKNVHPHTLRHTFATELLDQGFNIREVQDLLGHSDLSTTMIYTHVNPVTLREKIRLRV
jgi:integrase/recombinase XerD